MIVLRGEIDLLRRLPNSVQPKAIGEQNIRLDYTSSALQNEEDKNSDIAELAHGFFKLKKEVPGTRPSLEMKRKMNLEDGVDNEEAELLERLNAKYPFKKGCEVGIEERLAKGELGRRILQRTI